MCPCASRPVLEAEITGPWKAMVWIFETILRQRIVLKGDARDVITLFLKGDDNEDHPYCEMSGYLIVTFSNSKPTYLAGEKYIY